MERPCLHLIYSGVAFFWHLRKQQLAGRVAQVVVPGPEFNSQYYKKQQPLISSTSFEVNCVFLLCFLPCPAGDCTPARPHPSIFKPFLTGFLTLRWNSQKVT
jgi:hypothetical protein